jgi:ABC-type nickel/cobalt efflux system permease component RcnA
LLFAVVAVGVLHTIVPDHWAPIALLARRRGWTREQTAWAAFIAGLGHTLSTLAIGLVVWIAGLAFATRFGHYVSIASSVALVGFGLWIALSSLREIREEQGHHHDDEAQVAKQAGSRMTLLLILGSSPMVEAIPTFFAASKFGPGFIALMSLLFAASTIATYVVMCVYSTSALRFVSFGKFEEYGEVVSGAFIALVGLVFAFFPVA